MGNIRTPKTIYKDGLVISFYVQDKQVHYEINKWNKDGTNLALLDQGKLESWTTQQLIDYALQAFSSVRELEN